MISRDLFVYDFSNPDDVRLNQVLKNEEVESDPLSVKLEYLLPEKLHPQFARSPFVKSVNFSKLKLQNQLKNTQNLPTKLVLNSHLVNPWFLQTGKSRPYSKRSRKSLTDHFLFSHPRANWVPHLFIKLQQ